MPNWFSFSFWCFSSPSCILSGWRDWTVDSRWSTTDDTETIGIMRHMKMQSHPIDSMQHSAFQSQNGLVIIITKHVLHLPQFLCFPRPGCEYRVAPLNELLLPPAVTVSIISILITVHGKNSPNLRNKGFARPSVPANPGPRPHPLAAVFLLFSAKVWQSLMLHSYTAPRCGGTHRGERQRNLGVRSFIFCITAWQPLPLSFAKQPSPLSAKCETI